MTSKLELYNEALLHLGQERLASLSETSTAKYALDDAYDPTLKYCLEQGMWNFAIRVVSIDALTSVEPQFGFTYAFSKPDDFIRTLNAADNEYFRPSFMGADFADEPNYWFADANPIYVKFISDNVNFGKDLSIWPQTFSNYVGLRLANRVCKRVTGSMPTGDMFRLEIDALHDARSKDAMNQGPEFPPRGTWARSRGGGTANRSRWDRNS